MSSERSQSSGVRNLAARFENPDPPSSVRGRSPGRSSSATHSSGSPRRSVVRASFVPVEPAGRKASQNGTPGGQEVVESTAEKRRQSFSFDETADAKAVADLRKTISQELEKRRNSAAIETVPEVAVLTPAVERRQMEFGIRGRPMAVEKLTGTGARRDEEEKPAEAGNKNSTGPETLQADDGSGATQDTSKVDDVSSADQVVPPKDDPAGGDQAVSPTSHEPSQEPEIKDEAKDVSEGGELAQTERPHNELSEEAEVKIKLESPESDRVLHSIETPGGAGRGVKTQPSRAARVTTEKNPMVHKADPSVKPSSASKDLKVSGGPRKTASRSYSSQSAGNSPRPSLGTKPRSTSTKDVSKLKNEKKDGAETKKFSRQSLASTVSSTSFTKPRPKSPTRPAKLPTSITAPTAASAAKTAALAGASSSRTPTGASATSIARHGSTRSKSRPTPPTRTASVRATNGVARPAAPAAPASKPRAESHGAATGQKPAGQGFLARMMRPTASSASKAHEKVVPPAKPSAGHGHKEHKEHAGRLVEKEHGEDKGGDSGEAEHAGDSSV